MPSALTPARWARSSWVSPAAMRCLCSGAPKAAVPSTDPRLERHPHGCARRTRSTLPWWVMTSHTLDVGGARLYYEVRGSGPAVLLVGSPMAAAQFAPLADALAIDHTVITLDPRGISASRLENPDEETTVEQRADDVVAILDTLGLESADMFGSSGEAVTGLALVPRHPGRIRTLVAHEPPVQELLPDAADRRADVDDIVATFHREGTSAAFPKFMALIGVQPPANASNSGQAPIPAEQPTAQDIADGARFLGHDMTATTRFVRLRRPHGQYHARGHRHRSFR